MLGIERIGVHDNFLELGGDSIHTIQVVSRGRRAGYDLNPKDIFTHQTIGKLSQAIAERSEAVELGEQGFLTGSSGLLPIQQSFLQRAPEIMLSHFNQSILLKIDKAITENDLYEAVAKLTTHHDALRFKSFRREASWQQSYVYLTEQVNGLNI